MKKVVLLMITLGIFFLACQKKNTQIDEYFVSILPQKYFVERIVGDKFKIEVLVKPGDSPATYEPTAKQMIAMSKAKALFTIGVAFEKNIIPKLQEQYPTLNVVASDKGITKHHPASFQELFADEHSHHEHTSEHHHDHGEFDPHIWLSPALVKIQVMNITDYFVSTYPQDKNFFLANRDNFLADLEQVSLSIENIFQNTEKREFLCFHPAWGYFADQFGLKQIPIEIEGKEPTPQEQSKIISFAKERDIKFIFVQAQFDQRIASSIANEIGGKVILIDPLAEDYLANIKNIAQKIAESMNK